MKHWEKDHYGDLEMINDQSEFNNVLLVRKNDNGTFSFTEMCDYNGEVVKSKEEAIEMLEELIEFIKTA